MDKYKKPKGRRRNVYFGPDENAILDRIENVSAYLQHLIQMDNKKVKEKGNE